MAVLLPEQRIDDNFSIYYAEKEFSNKPIDMFEFPLAIAKPESEQEYYILLKLTQENGIEIYFTVNFRNAVVCSGHYSLLHLCFDYNNETKTLNLEIQKQFLMSKENLDIVSVSIISAPDYNMVQAEYQQMFGKMQEKLSLVCLLFDTGMENQRKFSDACQKVIDNLKEQENLFFCMATFDGKYGIQNISLLGAAQSSQLEVITNEIKKLSLVSSQNTCNPFPQICRQFAQIPLSPSLQITYGILMVTDGQHFPQDTRAAYLCYGTVKKLCKVQETLKEKGFRMIIWDAYRPEEAQYKLWEVYPDPTYVANPKKGITSHSRGNTIDIGIVYQDGSEVELPSAFDEFSSLADRDYSDVSSKAAQNSYMLEEIMNQYGFKGYWGEWWDYSDIETYDLIIPEN